ncbi:hypothetical protein F4777DRAFT_591519 [Nemania sp. FL0916]|nr:hypothetical protein F4777DRAFT_591519 [Nemania sp. FL0916]
MAPLPPLEGNLIGRDNTNSPHEIQVVCAWAVSGQYGFGTRLLYYILVATCVLARRKEWLRNACLAAALLLPAVAAVHAVVIAAVHKGAVDLDIYGAFQICSIGILAAPITAYNSKTYFNDPGRNIIFIWTGLLLAGMLSITVEVFRIVAHPCSIDGSGFPYGSANCNLTCQFGSPYSPIRQDSTNAPAVVPVPHRLSFSAVTLLAAGSSIPPVLTIIFTWEKILEINWKRRFGQDEVDMNETIEGTNGATPGMITVINGAIRNFLSSIQIPLFSGVVVVLLVLGELNFWSPQLLYQAEPFTSVGQWSNVVATFLLVLGSLFYVQNEREMDKNNDTGFNRSHDVESQRLHHSAQSDSDRSSMPSSVPEMTSPFQANMMTDTRTSGDTPYHDRQRWAGDPGIIDTSETYEKGVPLSMSNKHRNKVASALDQFGRYIGTPAKDRYGNSTFIAGKREFPAIPGEAGRVARFQEIQDRYKEAVPQEDEVSIGPGLSRSNSRTSFRHIENSPSNHDRSPSPSPPGHSPFRSNTTPVRPGGHSSFDENTTATSPGAGPSRHNTLQVPSRPRSVYRRPRNISSPSTPPQTMIPDAMGSPKIVVSAEPEETSPTIPRIDSSPFGPH